MAPPCPADAANDIDPHEFLDFVHDIDLARLSPIRTWSR
jgi:hypothetical protein